jgi:hypothetical protein
MDYKFQQPIQRICLRHKGYMLFDQLVNMFLASMR